MSQSLHYAFSKLHREVQVIIRRRHAGVTPAVAHIIGFELVPSPQNPEGVAAMGVQDRVVRVQRAANVLVVKFVVSVAELVFGTLANLSYEEKEEVDRDARTQDQQHEERRNRRGGAAFLADHRAEPLHRRRERPRREQLLRRQDFRRESRVRQAHEQDRPGKVDPDIDIDEGALSLAVPQEEDALEHGEASRESDEHQEEAREAAGNHKRPREHRDEHAEASISVEGGRLEKPRIRDPLVRKHPDEDPRHDWHAEGPEYKDENSVGEQGSESTQVVCTNCLVPDGIEGRLSEERPGHRSGNDDEADDN